MAFSVKNWQDDPSTGTPISAAALEDLETRLSDYTDSVASATAPEVVVTTLTTAAINSAAASLTPYGGTVKLLPSAEYLSGGTTLTIPSGVVIKGMGRRGSGIKRTGSNHILVDMSGSHAATTTTATNVRSGLADLYLDGGSNASWTDPLLRTYYCAEADISRVDFFANYGPCVDAVEFWDSAFYHCRFNDSGGTSGAAPCVLMRSTTGAGSGMGHSTDSCNNITFHKCTWETFRDGALWILQNGGANICHTFNLESCKMESTTLRGSFIKLSGVWRWRSDGLILLAHGFDSGYSTPINVIETNALAMSRFNDTWCSESTTQTVDNFFAHTGGGGGNSIDHFWAVAYTSGAPTSTLFEFSGTNNFAWRFDDVGIYDSTGFPSGDLIGSQAAWGWNTLTPAFFYKSGTITVSDLAQLATGGNGIPLIGTPVYDSSAKKIGIVQDESGTIVWTAALS